MKPLNRSEKFKRFVAVHDALLAAGAGAILAIFSVIRYFRAGDVLAYGDAESHINIAKRITGGLTPGFGQLGGIWLPLHHLLMVPFVINDYLWRTGLGGAIVSALCYVASVYFLYKLARLLCAKAWIAPVATAIYALNPNVLYMLATPMSELPLLAFMTASTYFFIRWMTTENIHLLVLAGLFSFCGVLVRYDGWFLILVQAVAVLMIGLSRKWPYRKLEGTAILLILPSLLAVFLWVAWCLLIFHNPLYFLNSPYSAHAQQQAFLARGELPTYHNLAESVIYYTRAVIDNSGRLLAALAGVGIVALVVDGIRKKHVLNLAVMLILLSSFFFNVVSLYLGISILFIPGLTPANFEFHLFNIRYGMMLLPAIAVIIGMLLNSISWKRVRAASTVAVGVAALLFSFTYPITLHDGISGLSARKPGPPASSIEDAFNANYDYGYVAFDDFGRSASPIDLHVPMNKMIYVGNHPYWEDTLKQPNRFARYVIIRKHDSLWQAFHADPIFQHDYRLLAERHDVSLYRCSVDCVGDVDLTKVINDK